jgi:predicted transcriptional regulator
MKLIREHVIAARGLLMLSQGDLARLAGVSERTLIRFESHESPIRADSQRQIQDALESCGIEFMNGDRPGVRYHPDRDRRRLAPSEPAKPVE